MKILGLIAVILTGGLLISAVKDFPDWGDPHSPANSYRESQRYIVGTLPETDVPNMVTAVLADYRGYDTMFETMVIFTAGISIIGILRQFKPSALKDIAPAELMSPREPDLILDTTTRMLMPVIQLFALYVLAHGHHSPGGGFQGGVIFASSYILLSLVRGLDSTKRWMPEKRVLIFAGLGVFIYSGIGLLCLLMGANFLDYGILHGILPGNAIEARGHGMMGIEIGVAFTVCAIMYSIYANISSHGKLDEGL